MLSCKMPVFLHGVTVLLMARVRGKCNGIAFHRSKSSERILLFSFFPIS